MILFKEITIHLKVMPKKEGQIWFFLDSNPFFIITPFVWLSLRPLIIVYNYVKTDYLPGSKLLCIVISLILLKTSLYDISELLTEKQWQKTLKTLLMGAGLKCADIYVVAADLVSQFYVFATSSDVQCAPIKLKLNLYRFVFC